MYSTLEVVLIAAVALLLGGLATFFFMRWRAPAGGRGEEELRQLRESHQHYRYEVTEHFSKTAEMLGQLANSYREVHNHLAQGAQSLCEPGAARTLRALPDDIGETQPARHEILEPPRDYSIAPEPHDEPAPGRERDSRAIIEPPRY